MVQVPLVKGVRSTGNADYAAVLPVNLEPVAEENGISAAYLRSAIGCRTWVGGPGVDRGGINWAGVLFRVMGTKLVQVDASGGVTVLGDVGGSGPVSLDYGFDRLAIASGGNLFYWDGTTLRQVTDPDLGYVTDALWISGYYATTDGTSLVVTQLSDPYAVDPLKYGSAEAAPDPIVALHKLRGELYALGTQTIQVYSQQGGSGFPFAPQVGATVQVGCCGTKAKAQFQQTLAWVGSARGEALGVYLMDGGNAVSIGTREVAEILAKVTDPTVIALESRASRDEQRLYVHLPNLTLVYLAKASGRLREPVWYIAQSGQGQPYRPRNAVACYGKWICGDSASSNLGFLEEVVPPEETSQAAMSFTSDGQTYGTERWVATGKRGERWLRPSWRPHKRFSRYLGIRVRSLGGSSHYGVAAGYSFSTPLFYNGAKGAILHSAELVGLPGRGLVAWNALECEIESLGR